MSGYICECCDVKNIYNLKEVTYIFSKGGGKKLADEYEIDLLGSIPIDPKLSESEDEGVDFIKKYSNSKTSESLNKIIDSIIEKINLKKEIINDEIMKEKDE
jgi:ATP-binding protein involved in chromosome partitioning